MQSPNSPTIQQSKIKSEYAGWISKKPKDKTVLTFISPFHKLQNVFERRESIQKYEVDQKKEAEKKKNMTCINLGVDQEYLDPVTPSQQSIIKIKSKQRSFQSQRKNRSKYMEMKKQQSHNISNKVPQSQHQKRFQFFEVNRQKENLMKFQKKLISNLQKKKDQKNNGKPNFSDKFKQVLSARNDFYLNFSKSSLHIKKQILHQTPLETKAKDDKIKTVKDKFLRSKQCVTFHRYNTSHNQRSYLHKKHSQGQLKPSMTSLLLYQNQIQEQISLNQTLDEIKIQKHKVQSYSASNILPRNSQTQQNIDNFQNIKTKKPHHELHFNKFELNKFQRNIYRSLNVSAYTKLVAPQKMVNLKQKEQLKQKPFIKSRNTCPAIQTQPVFTPWDNVPSQRSFLDEN